MIVHHFKGMETRMQITENGSNSSSNPVDASILLTAIAKASSLFLRADATLDQAISDFLKILGKASGVCRCYIFQNSSGEDGQFDTSLMYEWSREGCSRLNKPEYSKISWTKVGMSRWFERLSNDQPIQGLVAELPENEKKVLSPQNTKSFAVFPIMISSYFWGFIGYNDCVRERVWSPEEMHALAIAAAIIENAIEKLEAIDYLTKARRKYRSLVSALPFVILHIDCEGRILECSSIAEKVLGRSCEDLMGKNVASLCSSIHRDVFTDRLRRSLDTNNPDVFRITIMHADNVPVDMRVTITPVQISQQDMDYAVLTLEDYTVFRQMELENKALEEQINRRNRMESLASLAGGIAHDFSGILSVISWNAKLALRDLPRNSSSSTSIERILNATERSQELAQHMLAYAGKGYLNPVRVDLACMVSELCELVRPSLPKGIELHFSKPDALPELEADPTQIDQLIMNLIKNSIEAIREGVGTIELTLTQLTCNQDCFEKVYHGEAPESGEYILLTVSDDGEGMNENTMSKLFDPFFTTKSRGRGLGLSVVLGIVRAHEGAIQVQSRQGEGTTFRIFLPLVAKLPDLDD
ncbi:MAG: PAS domain S-box protein [Candidatus Aegiribacteria sp.]|nr:PAS domain S-box protein [Candidatus Aegiribacteria sp.]